MTQIFKNSLAITIGVGAGAIISGAIFAFIAIIGVVPRLAQKTKTSTSILLYEEMVILGGIIGFILQWHKVVIPITVIGAFAISFSCGIFYGVTAMSLAEVLNVLPILSRRINISKSMKIIVMTMAFSKLIASFIYFFIPGFLSID
jgi:stage V sporulation protein AB